MARFECVFVRVVAVPAIALLAFASIFDRGLANLGLAFLLFGFLVVIPLYWRRLSRDPLVWLTVLFFIWIPVSGMALAEKYPDYADIVREQAQDWLKLCFLPLLVTTFWLTRVPRLMLWLPLILASGYFARVIAFADWEMLLRLFQDGERAEFGLVATDFGMYSLFALVGALTGVRAAERVRTTWVRLALYTYSITVASVATIGIATAQTRSIWLAAILLIIAASIFALRNQRRSLADHGRLWLVLAGAGIVLASCVYAFGGIISTRLMEESETFLKVLALQFDGLNYNAIGYRIRAYVIGFEVWMNAPVSGQGPGIDRIAMLTTDDPEMRKIAHFHNEYLTILATYGVIGFAMFSALLVMMSRGAVNFRYGNSEDRCTFVFLAAIGLTIGIFSIFGQFLTSHHGPFIFALIGGMSLAGRERFLPRTASMPSKRASRRAESM